MIDQPNLFCFAGSARQASFNKRLARCAAPECSCSLVPLLKLLDRNVLWVYWSFRKLPLCPANLLLVNE